MKTLQDKKDATVVKTLQNKDATVVKTLQDKEAAVVKTLLHKHAVAVRKYFTITTILYCNHYFTYWLPGENKIIKF